VLRASKLLSQTVNKSTVLSLPLDISQNWLLQRTRTDTDISQNWLLQRTRTDTDIDNIQQFKILKYAIFFYTLTYF
jgi:hypothetical protein